MKKLIYSVLALSFVLSCSEKKQEDVEFRAIELSNSIRLNEQDKESPVFTIKFNFIELLNHEKSDRLTLIQNELKKQFFGNEAIHIQGNTQQQFDQLIEELTFSYRKDGQQMLKEFPEMKNSLNYELTKSAKIIYNQNKILSVQVESYEYAGGAHGLENITYLHFDLNSGKIFGIKDLFEKDEEQKLYQLLNDKCSEMKKNGNSEVFDDAEIESCENFYFDERNFYFVFNPYEIGPYSAGYITIEIPVSDIKPLLKKDIQPGFLM